jgi:hypothetical protein
MTAAPRPLSTAATTLNTSAHSWLIIRRPLLTLRILTPTDDTLETRWLDRLPTHSLRPPQLHTGAVDVAGLELCGLRNSQPAGIDRNQEHSVWRRQDRFDLTAREHFRAPGWRALFGDRCHQVDRTALTATLTLEATQLVYS